MSRFDDCLKFVLSWEGGYTNDPDDPGGATNFGIIQKEYDLYRKAHSLPSQSVKNISQEEYTSIYTTEFWNPVHGGTDNAPLDLVLFDAAVNNGVGMSIRWLQASIGTAADGDWGSGTDAALANYLKTHTVKDLSVHVCNLRESRYRSLVQQHPKLAKFLKGWLARLNDVRKHAGINGA